MPNPRPACPAQTCICHAFESSQREHVCLLWPAQGLTWARTPRSAAAAACSSCARVRPGSTRGLAWWCCSHDSASCSRLEDLPQAQAPHSGSFWQRASARRLLFPQKAQVRRWGCHLGKFKRASSCCSAKAHLCAAAEVCFAAPDELRSGELLAMQMCHCDTLKREA